MWIDKIIDRQTGITEKETDGGTDKLLHQTGSQTVTCDTISNTRSGEVGKQIQSVCYGITDML